LASDQRTYVNVSDKAKKHLARNVPTDFSGYCAQIAKRYDSETCPKSQRDLRNAKRRWLGRHHIDLLNICDLNDISTDVEKNEFSDQVFEVAVKYEALLTSVDYSIEPGRIHKQLRQVTTKLSNVIEVLDDEIRNQVVCEMMDCAGLNELPKTMVAFEAAPSLAAKVTITELLLKEALNQFLEIEKHFQYKGGVATVGTPAKYAFSFAVFALAEVFEQHDQQQRKAMVSQRSTASDTDDGMNWSGLFSYSSGYLRFVRSFFEIYNPNEFRDRVATGFDTAVRRAAQKRKKNPNLHQLLDGKTNSQDVLDFMVGLDAIR
jgi:hypothetical protein